MFGFEFDIDKRTLKIFFIGMAACAVLVAVILLCYMKLSFAYSVDSPDSTEAYKKINEIMEIIDQYYIEEVDYEQLANDMFVGLLSGLEDEYAAYFTEEEYETLSLAQQGQFEGIGITISKSVEDGTIVIVDVEEDGPADLAGIMVDDVITSVDGEDVSEMDTSEVSALIQESESDDVILEIYRESTDKNLRIVVTKGLVESISVSGSMLEDYNIGYIYISSFTGVTADQLVETLEQLQEENAESLIIDLRGNSGGLVTAACDALREFIPDGVLVYMEDRYGDSSEYTSESGNEVDMPIVVLVDENTASAAEIFAGAMQDYEIAQIVGEQTFGKGVVQNAFHLGDGSVIRITVSHYYTPNGNDIHEVGITPDVVVEYDDEGETDTQLEAAIELLTS